MCHLNALFVFSVARLLLVGVFNCDDSNEINVMGGVTVFSKKNKSESQHFKFC